MHHSHKITSCFTGVAGEQVSLSLGLVRRYWWDARATWAWDKEISHSRCRWGWWEQSLLCITTGNSGMDRTFLSRWRYLNFLKNHMRSATFPIEWFVLHWFRCLKPVRSIMLCLQFPISHGGQEHICNSFLCRCFHLQSWTFLDWCYLCSKMVFLQLQRSLIFWGCFSGCRNISYLILDGWDLLFVCGNSGMHHQRKAIL